MNLLYCARCNTPLMNAATVHICPTCGAVYRQHGTHFSFVADLSGVSVKELMQSIDVYKRQPQRCAADAGRAFDGRTHSGADVANESACGHCVGDRDDHFDSER